ncbi:MAG: MATE family efflux transporter [Muribaculaceae bacterium]|nr:MATE family efflux transporter [Muribaculaceae bacterium]
MTPTPEAPGRRFTRYCKDYKRILQLGAPILVGQLGMIVVGFADNAMIGHYSTDTLAAASFVNNVFNTAILMAIGFTYGLTPLLGAMFSTGNFDKIGATLRKGLWLNIIYALILTAVMTIVYFNLERLGQPEHLLPLIRPYFLIYLAGILPIVLFQVFAQCAYAVNSTKMPMWIVLGANAVNVGLNALLIYGTLGFPELGLTGAGIATLIARWLCPLAIVVIFRTRPRYAKIANGFAKCRESLSAKKLITTGLPVSFQMGFETASFSAAAVMAGWLGHLQLAAFQIIVIVGMFGFCVYYGMGTAVSVLVANASTDGGNRRMREVAIAGYHIHLILVAAASILFAIFGHEMTLIFTSDPEVEAMTMTLIIPLILYQVADATQINFSNALRGTANVIPMLWSALVAYIIIGIPATYIMGFTLDMGIVGIVYSFSVSLIVAASLYLYFFMKTTSYK